MTIDEAIKHAEEVAKDQEELYGLCPISESELSHCDGTKDCKAVKNGENKGCLKCAKEHHQLAEWLKELKQLKEQEPFINKPCVAHQVCHEDKVKVLDKIKAEIEQNAYPIVSRYNTIRGMTLNGILQIIDKYKAESEGI